jgi:GT2 family glycosyltransferase
LADDMLLGVGWCLAPATSMTAILERGHDTCSLTLRAIDISRPDLPDRPHPVGKALVMRFPPGLAPRSMRGKLRFTAPGGTFVTTTQALDGVTCDVSTLAGARLGWLDGPARDRIMEFLVESLTEPSRTSHQLAGSLRDIWCVLRGPTPPTSAGSPSPSLEHIYRIDDQSFYLRGSIPAIEAVTHLAVVTPEGRRVELDSLAFRHRHADRENGAARETFVAYVQLAGPSVIAEGWSAELTSDGNKATTVGAEVAASPDVIRQAILEDLRFEDRSNPRLIPGHTFPALQRLQARRADDSLVDEPLDFGKGCDRPEVSIIIPLFGRLDLIEHQLAHFVDDADLDRAELIYVVDSPTLASAARTMATELHDLYRMPFRLVVLPKHLGFGLATNRGMAIARGRLVLMLNSDVFPVESGWLRRLVRFHDATPRIGALGPKLLFEDDTLQHAGLYFERGVGSPLWMNRHYYKGFHRLLPAANVARPVPAVTGACLMIDRELLLTLGGFRSCYVDGDYEDSDLCLRLLMAGRENWYVPDIELYHLEGQSYQWDDTREWTALYNAWVHSHFWSDTIEAVMQQYRSTSNPSGRSLEEARS